MKKMFFSLLVIFFLFSSNEGNCSHASFEELERKSVQGDQRALCEFGSALLTGSFGNMHDKNYKRIKPNAEKSFVYLEKAVDTAAYGEPNELTYPFIVDALNALGSYYEIEKDNNNKAIDYYKKSADLFVRFGGDFEGVIAGMNYNRLTKSVTD